MGGNQSYSLIISGFDQVTLGNKDFSSNFISIFPNPTYENITITSSNGEIHSYNIFDLQGRLVQADKINNLNQFSVNMSSFNSGVYIVELHSLNGISKHKIVKK